MATCPKCAAENRGTKAACWNCWSPLDEAPAGGGRERVRTPGISVSVPWPLVFLILAVAAAGVVGYFYMFASRPEQVAAIYADAVLNGLDARHDEVVSQGSQGQPLLSGVLSVANFTCDTVAEVNGDQATVPATCRLTIDGDKVTPETAASALVISKMIDRDFNMSIVLVKEGSEWKVDQRATQDSLFAAATRSVPPHLQGMLRGNTIPKVLPQAPAAAAGTPGRPGAPGAGAAAGGQLATGPAPGVPARPAPGVVQLGR